MIIHVSTKSHRTAFNNEQNSYRIVSYKNCLYSKDIYNKSLHGLLLREMSTCQSNRVK